ncbi:NAD(P)-dependent oxidoreductase [Eubacterium sp. AB3007]|uniref:NAD(P)-dependent oxidoreductase n=1 Tax=Eubacterium sp. AB3007 TaxID=1392487 RepID=UPI000483CE26|nr:NAD(P)-dependent oxidoreductase [Eubacterium sp. AB3007]
MKMFVYGLREYDERVYFDKFAALYGIEFDSVSSKPTLKNVDLAKGYDAINILTAPVDKAMIDAYYDLGVRCIMTRTIGYDHIDYNYAREKGMGVLNITYSPATVADYTVMMILLGIRKLKYIRQRAALQDYTLEGKLACELGSLTVGIVGTGRIGACVARELTGFGCRMLAYDPFPHSELSEILTYTDMDTLLRESDVITLHAPATESNFHILDADAFARMKPGSGLVNCARGPLVDSDAMIDAIESGQLGFACLDTIEDEYGIYYYNRMGRPLTNRQLAILNSYPNVIVTPHMAFYTREAVSDMVENSILGILQYFREQ